MPQHKSAAKRVRQSARRRARNRVHRSRMRTMVRRVLQSDDHSQVVAEYPQVQAYLDRLASKGVIHRNKAIRYKRQMTRHLHAFALSGA